MKRNLIIIGVLSLLLVSIVVAVSFSTNTEKEYVRIDENTVGIKEITKTMTLSELENQKTQLGEILADYESMDRDQVAYEEGVYQINFATDNLQYELDLRDSFIQINMGIQKQIDEYKLELGRVKDKETKDLIEKEIERLEGKKIIVREERELQREIDELTNSLPDREIAIVWGQVALQVHDDRIQGLRDSLTETDEMISKVKTKSVEPIK